MVIPTDHMRTTDRICPVILTAHHGHFELKDLEYDRKQMWREQF